MTIKCSDCQTKFLPNYPRWLRLFHIFEFLRYQEMITDTLYETCMNDLMAVKYAVDLLDEQREERERNEAKDTKTRRSTGSSRIKK